MSKSVTGFGVVRAGGTVLISHRSRFDSAIVDTFGEGERVCVTVEKTTRSLRQNNLYHVWCTKIGEHFGCSKEYIHAENKRLFNRRTEIKTNPRTGEITEDEYPASTADLSVDAFAEFMQRVQQRWAEEGIDLPGPNDEEY